MDMREVTVALIAVSSCYVGCSDDSASEACGVEGDTQPCSCDDSDGSQSCLESGAWSSCACVEDFLEEVCEGHLWCGLGERTYESQSACELGEGESFAAYLEAYPEFMAGQTDCMASCLAGQACHNPWTPALTYEDAWSYCAFCACDACDSRWDVVVGADAARICTSEGLPIAGCFIGECCLNGSFFSCLSEEAMDTCTLADQASACTRDESFDGLCLTE